MLLHILVSVVYLVKANRKYKMLTADGFKKKIEDDAQRNASSARKIYLIFIACSKSIQQTSYYPCE